MIKFVGTRVKSRRVYDAKRGLWISSYQIELLRVPDKLDKHLISMNIIVQKILAQNFFFVA
ncbi:MAG: hypothetical protein COB40_04360 [Marinosulfonomonas sp.]|nr:MAG: hypothetical protein COB40_04360 [Marinosulfonomonas sp.]